MSGTYPDIDVTDPREPVYDDEYKEIQDDIYLTEFCKEREQEAIEAQDKADEFIINSFYKMEESN